LGGRKGAKLGKNFMLFECVSNFVTYIFSNINNNVTPTKANKQINKLMFGNKYVSHGSSLGIKK